MDQGGDGQRVARGRESFSGRRSYGCQRVLRKSLDQVADEFMIGHAAQSHERPSAHMLIAISGELFQHRLGPRVTDSSKNLSADITDAV